jgi:hypothetical protein
MGGPHSVSPSTDGDPKCKSSHVLANVGLSVSIFNLITSLLSLFGFGTSDE